MIRETADMERVYNREEVRNSVLTALETVYEKPGELGDGVELDNWDVAMVNSSLSKILGIELEKNETFLPPPKDRLYSVQAIINNVTGRLGDRYHG